MASWRRAFRLHLEGGTVEQDVDDEIAFHLETRTRELIEDGMAAHAAREEALRLFGDSQRVRRACVEIGHRRERGRRRLELFAELRQDAAFALRQLRRTPAFTLVAVLTLALGIGATAAIFSVLFAVVLRPLPFEHPARLVLLWAEERGEPRSASPGSFLMFRREMRSLERLAAFTTAGASFNLTGDGPPERIEGARASAGFFEVFGARPAAGRVFSAEEDRPGRERVVVLSDRLWRSRFAADPAAVGRTVRLNGLPHTILGVMPASFDLRADGPRLWVPLALDAGNGDFGNRYLRQVGRLRPGVSLAAAEAEADAVARRLAELDPQSNAALGARVELYLDQFLGGYRRRLWILFGAVGCVLAIACGNVANLLLARGAGRSREIAIRAALGAGRGRILRQLLTESLVLALAGAVVGLALAALGVRILIAAGPAGLPRLQQASIDGAVLAFTLALSLLASLLFGIVPALKTARADLQGMLKEGGASLGSATRDRVRNTLMVAEVALALVLLVAAGLLIRSALRLQEVEVGFDPSHLITARVSLPRVDYGQAERATAGIQRMVEQVADLPGVKSAAAISILPLSAYSQTSSVRFDGRPPRPDDPSAETRAVTPGSFRTLRIPVLAGRDFTPRDRQGAPGVVAVNQALARLAWPGRSALGKRLDYTGEPLEVVAVVGDARLGRLEEEIRPAFYVPLAQYPIELWDGEIEVALLARTAGDPTSQAAELRRAVQAVDPRLPLFSIATMEQIRASTVASTRLNTLLLTLLGALGLILAAAGIYGVVAYFVSHRTQEIGVRMALGASERRVLALVVGQALRPLAMGLALGLAGALAASRVLSGFLFEVSATDPATFLGVLLVLAAAALLASWLPARRAARVDPTRALAP